MEVKANSRTFKYLYFFIASLVKSNESTGDGKNMMDVRMRKSDKGREPYFRSNFQYGPMQGVWITKKVHFHNGPVNRYIAVLK